MSNIEELKAKYGQIWQVECETSDGKSAQFIVKKPDRDALSAIASYATSKQTQKANDTLIKNCVVEGDKDLIEKDDEVYYSILSTLSELLEPKKASIKKL